MRKQISSAPLYVRGEMNIKELSVKIPDRSTLKGLLGDPRDIAGELMGHAEHQYLNFNISVSVNIVYIIFTMLCVY